MNQKKLLYFIERRIDSMTYSDYKSKFGVENNGLLLLIAILFDYRYLNIKKASAHARAFFIIEIKE